MNLKQQTKKELSFFATVEQRLKNPEFMNDEDKEFENHYAVPNMVLTKMSDGAKVELLSKLRETFGTADDNPAGNLATVKVEPDKITVSEITK